MEERRKRKVVQSEGRQIIANVYHYLKEEYEFTELHKEPNADITHLRNITKRTASATGVSERTVQKILKEERDMAKERDMSKEEEVPSTSTQFNSPMKKRRKRETKSDINGFTADIVRTTIQDFHIVQNQIPTLKKLRAVLYEKIGFDGCIATLRKMLHQMGYRWRKVDNKRKVLVERHEVQILRLEYLKKINEYRSQGRPIVYTDEISLLTTQVKNSPFAQNEKAFPLVKKHHTTCFMLVHAGTEAGFIENAALIYKPATKVGEFHSNMTVDKYVRWLDEQLLPNVPEHSVIVLDNASYQTSTEKLPTAAATKYEMQQWLTSMGIEFDPNLRQIELYDIIRKYKSDFATYKIDDCIKSKGFEVLRLPPCHPELNVTENILGVLKNYIVARNLEEYTTAGEALIHESIAKITSETWRNTCNRIIKKEIEYMKYFDTDFELRIYVQDDTDEEENDSEGESSYDSN